MPLIIRVGIAGLGTVGSEAVRLLAERGPEFSRRLGADLKVVAVCDRKVDAEAKRLGLPASVRRFKRPADLAADKGLDVVVETLGGMDEARTLVLTSLRAGRHVVTANKRLLAHHWNELFETAAASRRRLLFEASVAGGIPILQALHQSLAANSIRRVLGILNGTTNFILTRMAHDGATLEDALAEAQRRGLAERDPSMDLDGTDAAHKVAVIASLVTGRWVKPEAVARVGIGGVSPEDFRFGVSSLDRTVRLLGVLDLDWRGDSVAVRATVQPTLVPLSHPLAAVHGEYNAVLVQADAAGDLMFYGRGAGGGPAASAVVGDVFQLGQEIAAGRGDLAPAALWGRPSGLALADADDGVSSFYLRLTVQDKPGALGRITGLLGKRGISIARIHQEQALGQRSVPVFLTTHPARRRDFKKAVADVLRLAAVAREHTWMPLL